MKSFFVNLLIVVLVVAAYVAGVFDFFTQKAVLWGAIGAIVVLFILALKIIGLPQK